MAHIVLLVIFVAALVPSIIIALMGSKIINEIGKYPSRASRIFLSRLIFLILAEGAAIGTFLYIYNLYAITGVKH